MAILKSFNKTCSLQMLYMKFVIQRYELESLKREASVHAAVDHPKIVAFKFFWIESPDSIRYFIMFKCSFIYFTLFYVVILCQNILNKKVKYNKNKYNNKYVVRVDKIYIYTTWNNLMLKTSIFIIINIYSFLEE